MLGLKIIAQFLIKANRGGEIKTRSLIRSLPKSKSKNTKKPDLQFPLLKNKSYSDAFISDHVQGLSFVPSFYSSLAVKGSISKITLCFLTGFGPCHWPLTAIGHNENQ